MHNCEKCIHSSNCEAKETVEKRGLECYKYELSSPLTLNDKINQMTPEEKAEWLWNHDETTSKLGRLTKEALLAFLTKPIESL